jgi:protein TonB
VNRTLALAATLVIAACGDRPAGTVTLPAGTGPSPDRRDESPVPLNEEAPAVYPAPLLEQRIGGTVVLRLFVDEAGRLVPDSTRIEESSGYPALDSAALEGAPRLRYAPALREGRPVAVPFLQPFTFRAPPGGGSAP